MAPFLFTSQRLGFREMEAADGDWFYRLNEDPEVIRHTGDPPFANKAAANHFVQHYDAYRKTGMGRWVLQLLENGQPIGWCGLKRRATGDVDVGFRLFRSQWGQGLATEAAKRCLQWGFDTLLLHEIIGEAQLENGASIRVLQKIGMDRQAIITLDGKAGERYSIDRATYQKRTS